MQIITLLQTMTETPTPTATATMTATITLTPTATLTPWAFSLNNYSTVSGQAVNALGPSLGVVIAITLSIGIALLFIREIRNSLP
jgi:hypothetical protein